MAADILVFLKEKNKLPKEYWILELSADLRERQKQMLTEIIPEFLDNIKWLNELPVIQEFKEEDKVAISYMKLGS